MGATSLSLMDENPNLESHYRNLSLLATVAVAVHLSSWTIESSSDSLARWLVSAMPPILTGLFLFGLLFYVSVSHHSYDQGARLFSLTTTSKRSGHGKQSLRISCDPAREDRHVFNVEAITSFAALGVSIDLIYVWYLLCRGLWDEMAKEAPNVLLGMVAFITGFLVILLCATWAPLRNLMQTKRDFGGEFVTEVSENGDAGLSPRLGTLIAAAEGYEKCLRSRRQPSDAKMIVIGEFLGVLREWQTGDQ